jgi:hypothetical protein
VLKYCELQGLLEEFKKGMEPSQKHQ